MHLCRAKLPLGFLYNGLQERLLHLSKHQIPIKPLTLKSVPLKLVTPLGISDTSILFMPPMYYIKCACMIKIFMSLIPISLMYSYMC